MQSQSVAGCALQVLKQALEPLVPVYGDDAPQEPQGPCVLVVQRRFAQRPDGGATWRRRHTIRAQYIPGGAGPGLDDMTETLAQHLLCLPLEGLPLRAESLRAHVRDGTLCFLADYSMRVRPPVDMTAMQNLDIHQNMKEE